MNCLACAWEIPKAFFSEWSLTADSKYGVFRCPRCHTSHLRRLAGHRPDGEPVFEFRLWGHPATSRRLHRADGVAAKTSN